MMSATVAASGHLAPDLNRIDDQNAHGRWLAGAKQAGAHVITKYKNERKSHGERQTLPIRLTPMTATCRVPPLSRVKLGIGWSRGVARDAEQ